jgi:hypothetical protein
MSRCMRAGVRACVRACVFVCARVHGRARACVGMHDIVSCEDRRRLLVRHFPTKALALNVPRVLGDMAGGFREDSHGLRDLFC